MHRLMMVNIVASTNTQATTTGVSFRPMQSTSSRPMPGQENTVSTSTAPPREKPNCSPTVVTIGIMALRRAWRKISAGPEMPLLSASSM